MKSLGTRYSALLLAACVIVSALAFTSNVRQTSDEPALTLMVSQAIIDKHTIKLNGYKIPTGQPVISRGDDIYSPTPLGTSIMALPAVYIMNRLGMDMQRPDDMARGQKYITMLLNPAIFLLIFLLGRYYISERASLIISSIAFMGSSLSSTLSTALWSHNFAILIAVTVMHQLVRRDLRMDNTASPFTLGALLFMAYLTRPAMATLALAALGFLALRDRAMLIKTATSLSALLAAFVAISYYSYQLPLPPAYAMRLDAGEFFTALYATALSPSRGLFIYSPFMLVLAALSVYYFHHLRANRVFVFALTFIALNLLATTLRADWHGAVAYGSRMMVDSMPASILLAFMLWRHIKQRILLFDHTANNLLRPIGISFVVLGVLSIWINSYQGLFNQWTYLWNKYPPIETEARRIVLDWRHPQMFSSGELLRDKVLWFHHYRGHDVSVDHANMRLIDFDSSSSHSYIIRGRTYMDKGLFEKALDDFHKAIELEPDNSEAFFSRGSLWLAMNNSEAAIADLSNALSMDPAHSASYIARATAYDRTEQYALSLGDYTAAIAQTPAEDTAALGQLLLKQGIASFRAGDYKAATASLETAIQKGAGTREAYFHLAAALYASRQYARAGDAFSSMLALYPDDERGRLFLLNSLRKDSYYDTGQGLTDLKEFVVSTPATGLVRTISRFYLSISSYNEDEIIEMVEAGPDSAQRERLLCETYYYLAEQRLAHNETIWARGLLKKGEKLCAPDQIEYHTTKALLRWLGR